MGFWWLRLWFALVGCIIQLLVCALDFLIWCLLFWVGVAGFGWLVFVVPVVSDFVVGSLLFWVLILFFVGCGLMAPSCGWLLVFGGV